MIEERRKENRSHSVGAVNQYVKSKTPPLAYLAWGVICCLLLSLEAMFLLLALSHNFHFTTMDIVIFSAIGLVTVLISYATTTMLIQPISIYLYILHASRELVQNQKPYAPLTALAKVYKTPIYYRSSTQYEDENNLMVEDAAQLREKNLLLLGGAGVGKTMFLSVSLYNSLRHYWQFVRGQRKIPVFIAMRDFNAFLMEKDAASHSPDVQNGMLPVSQSLQTVQHMSLVNYLFEGSDVRSIRFLHPCLRHLEEHGYLQFICDGLNEIDTIYMRHVCMDLKYIMRETENDVWMTCRELDYNEQPSLQQLADTGYARLAVLPSLHEEQMQNFVERYVTSKKIKGDNEQWNYTADMFMDVIKNTRLRDHCVNPMMLFISMKVIDWQGIEQAEKVDTRGRLLQAFVKLVIEHERQKSKWSKKDVTLDAVMLFLGEIAFASRCLGYRNSLFVPMISGDLAESLRIWLEDVNTEGNVDFIESGLKPLHTPYHDTTIRQLLEFAQDTTLLVVNQKNVISFTHELVAEGLASEYILRKYEQSSTNIPFEQIMLEDVGIWSGPIALWAGLLENPLALARLFADVAKRQPHRAYSALALSLVCAGVAWMPLQISAAHPITLPTNVLELLNTLVAQQDTRQQLADMLRQCAEDGGVEVYRALLPLLSKEETGIIELLTLLDRDTMPALLFDMLKESIRRAEPGQKAVIDAITRALGGFGSISVSRAIALSHMEQNEQLRRAAITILGRSGDQQAVEPLLLLVKNSEGSIREDAANALVRLGPTLVVDHILRLMSEDMGPSVHAVALFILEGLLLRESPRVQRAISATHYTLIIELLILFFSDKFHVELRNKAEMCVYRQAIVEAERFQQRRDIVITSLIQQLAVENDDSMLLSVIELLKRIGKRVVPQLCATLAHKSSPIIRVRIIEILGEIRDMQVLPQLLQMIIDPSPIILREVSIALAKFAPASIHGLIEIVLSPGKSEITAARAAECLKDIGEESIGPVVEALHRLIPERTKYLVQVVETVAMPHDQRAISTLVALLKHSRKDIALMSVLVLALRKFPDEQVVSALLDALENSKPPLSQQISAALSNFNILAVNPLIAALDNDLEPYVLSAVLEALCTMQPFPAETLLATFVTCSDVHAKQVMKVFHLKGSEAVQFLVGKFGSPQERVRYYIHQILKDVDKNVLIPLLIEEVKHQHNGPDIAFYLHKYTESIPYLVNLLGESHYSAIVIEHLLGFGETIISHLGVALNDEKNRAKRRQAQNLLITLTQQDIRALMTVVQLFAKTGASEALHLANESLIDVLASDLTYISVPTLLSSLESEEVTIREGAAQTLARIIAIHDEQASDVLVQLLQSLQVNERREGAERTLTLVGTRAIEGVGQLIVNKSSSVAESARRILTNMGMLALPFIYAMLSDVSKPERQRAAHIIYRNIPTSAIQERLLELLTSDNVQENKIGVLLLIERINDENTSSSKEQTMMDVLVKYVIAKKRNSQHLIGTLLLFKPEHIVKHLLQMLSQYPHYDEDILYLLLLLDDQREVKEQLRSTLHTPHISQQLHGQIVGILAIMEGGQESIARVGSIDRHGISSQYYGSVQQPAELGYDLRALGGLLVSDKFSVTKLKELQAEPERSPGGQTLYVIVRTLLGERYDFLLRDEKLLRKQERDAAQQQHQEDTKLIKSQKEALEQAKDDIQDLKKAKEVLERRIQKIRRQSTS